MSHSGIAALLPIITDKGGSLVMLALSLGFVFKTNIVSIGDECGRLPSMRLLWSHSQGFLPPHSVSSLVIRRGDGLYV